MGRVLGIDAGLDGVTVKGHLVLGEAQRLARGDAHLRLDQVDALAADAHDLLGDGVLDLQPGVHLHEEELARGLVRDQELHRPGTHVVHRGRRRHGRGTDLGADARPVRVAFQQR